MALLQLLEQTALQVGILCSNTEVSPVHHRLSQNTDYEPFF